MSWNERFSSYWDASSKNPPVSYTRKSKTECEFSKTGPRKITGLKILSGCKNTSHAAFHAHAHLSFLLLLPLLYFECICGEKQGLYLLSIYNLRDAVLSAFCGYLTKTTQQLEGATVSILIWQWRHCAASSESSRNQALNHCTYHHACALISARNIYGAPATWLGPSEVGCGGPIIPNKSES